MYILLSEFLKFKRCVQKRLCKLEDHTISPFDLQEVTTQGNKTTNRVVIGSTTDDGVNQLQVTGPSKFSGAVAVNGDTEILDATKGLILKAPNGTRYRLTVANDGTLITTAI